MSVLTAASSNSVMRGYEYYKNGNVLSCEQIDKSKYEGYVKGSNNNTYHVIIDLEHPRKSICDCPHASNNYIVCKHKVAMYFYLCPEEVQDYEDRLNSSYYDEYIDEDEYDDYEEDYEQNSYSHSTKALPSCFDDLLESYINDLSIEELKEFARKDLNEDRNYTFNHLLKDKYSQYLKKGGKDLVFIENLREKLIEELEIYDYDYCDYYKELFSNLDKTNIKSIINKNSRFADVLKEILLNPKLAIYSDYLWFIKYIKNILSEQEKNIFNNKMQDFLNHLKNYGIRNSTPKANMLVAMYEFNDYNDDKLAELLVRNAKYKEYILYVVYKTKDIEALYRKVLTRIDKFSGFDKKTVVDIILEFDDVFNNKYDKSVLSDYCYYNFLLNYDIKSIRYLISIDDDSYLNKIKEKAKSSKHLLPLYAETKQHDKLYELVKLEDKEYLYDTYLGYLKEQYSNELYDYYKDKVYLILKQGMGRDTYFKAASYFSRIKKLNDGVNLVFELLNELKNSQYKNRPALFDEINVALKRNI